MRAYESAIIYAESLGQDDIDESVESIKAILEKHNAKDVEVQPWGKRRLAYEIKKNQHAHYVFISFEAEPAVVAELDEMLRIDKNVLRFQTYLHTGDPETNKLHFRNFETLLGYVTDRGKIRPSRSTRLNAPEQRELARQIKRARMLAILPYTTMGN